MLTLLKSGKAAEFVNNWNNLTLNHPCNTHVCKENHQNGLDVAILKNIHNICRFIGKLEKYSYVSNILILV